MSENRFMSQNILIYKMATLPGFLRHHYFSVLRVTSGSFESVAKLAKQTDKLIFFTNKFILFPTSLEIIILSHVSNQHPFAVIIYQHIQSWNVISLALLYHSH